MEVLDKYNSIIQMLVFVNDVMKSTFLDCSLSSYRNKYLRYYVV